MRRFAVRCVVLIACLATASAAMADDNFRCGAKLVTPGMTQAQVLQYCGPPSAKSEEKMPVRSGNRVVGETVAYRWTYAANGATRVLVFDLDVLKSIE